MPKKYIFLQCDEEDGYRYRLDVSTLIPASKRVIVVQLNPSTADCKKSDPTIGKVSCWARKNEFGSVTFLNLFAFRTPDPVKLIGKSYEEIVGSRNNAVCESALRNAEDTIVFAWGGVDGIIASHCTQRLIFLRKLLGDRPVNAVGKAVRGIFPRHGLMWNRENRGLRKYEWVI